jgi:curved DNA-binding protein
MDYYNILGVDKNAATSEIKAAYKKLAMQHHPDHGGDVTQFQKINEAYETLKDTEKRSNYDRPKSRQSFNVNSENFEDMFSSFFGQRQQIRRNRDIKLQITMTLEDVAEGKDFIATYSMFTGQQSTANIRIHQGVLHGEVIRFKGLGDNSILQLPRGDLLIQVRVVNHNRFERDGRHLKTNVDVNIFDLILGTEVLIEKLTGGTIRVSIPTSTQSGTILSIAGQGLPDPRTGTTGNLYLKIKGITPKITDKEILERIQDINDAINNRT